MSRLTVRLPESLHQTLIVQAKEEGISLNQYIIYNLARVAYAYTAQPVEQAEQEQERQKFQDYLANAKVASAEESAAFLASPPLMGVENYVDPELERAFRQLLQQTPYASLEDNAE
ncbi:MAG: toxin-antitoxin system HicB family antitoxin [Deinococcales bacterium]